MTRIPRLLLLSAALFAAVPSTGHAQDGNNEAFVTHVYQTVLRRAPDGEGFAYWAGRMNAGMTRPQVATGLYESHEYGRRSNEDFVDSLYRLALCREPDAGGRTYWLGRMQQGLGRGGVVREIFASPEAQEKAAACPELPRSPAPVPPSSARAPDASQVRRPVEAAIQSVRFEMDANAVRFLASDQQGAFLLGDHWSRATDAQRREFARLFNGLLGKIMFPRVRTNLKNLASVRYEAPVLNGGRATLASTIVIEHPTTKQEMRVTYHLVRVGADWRLLDLSVLGDSLLTGIRADQVQPLLREGGVEMLLHRMRELYDSTHSAH